MVVTFLNSATMQEVLLCRDKGRHYVKQGIPPRPGIFFQGMEHHISATGFVSVVVAIFYFAVPRSAPARESLFVEEMKESAVLSLYS